VGEKMKIVLTFDVDWAKDIIITDVLNILGRDVPCTFFQTHSTEVFHGYSNVTHGIHPNFFKNSSHGVSESDVVAHTLNFVPDCVGSRAHGISFSSKILFSYLDHGVTNEFSLLAPLSHTLTPITHEYNGKKLFRMPYNWEDDIFFYYSDNSCYYDLDYLSKFDVLFMDFHPIHVFLNSSNTSAYNTYKEVGTSVRAPGYGSRTLLEAIVAGYRRGEIQIIGLEEYTKALLL
jgi:hypothetical protein